MCYSNKELQIKKKNNNIQNKSNFVMSILELVGSRLSSLFWTFFFFNPYENNEWRNISRTKATEKVGGRCCALFSQLAKVVV